MALTEFRSFVRAASSFARSAICFALEQRGRADFAASRENDSLSRNVFAGECGHRQSRFYLFALERVFQFRKNDDVAE